MNKKIMITANKVERLKDSPDARAQFVVNDFDAVAEEITERVLSLPEYSQKGAIIEITVRPMKRADGVQ